MSDLDIVQFNLMVSITDGTDDELDRLTRHLLRDLKELDVESARFATGGSAPDGTKAVAEVVTAGAIALAVLPNALPKVIEFLHAWSLQGRGRTIKFKGKIAGQNIDFEGSFAEMEKLVAMLETKQKKQKK